MEGNEVFREVDRYLLVVLSTRRQVRGLQMQMRMRMAMVGTDRFASFQDEFDSDMSGR